MKKLVLLAALLMVTSNAYAADDTAATKPDDPVLKHCRSMMKDGKMMDGMPKQMTDKCKTLMQNDGMKGMDMNVMQPEADQSGSSEPARHHPDASE